MNKIIFYKSRYGCSHQYAEWLADTLDCKVESVENMASENLQVYDTILYVGGLYAGSVNGFKKLRRQLATLQDKQIILCIVGLGNPDDLNAWQQYYQKNVPEQYQSFVRFFPLRGNQLFSKMSFLHRFMMKFPKAEVDNVPPEQRTVDQVDFLENFGKDVRFADRDAIKDIVTYVEGLAP